MSGGYDAGLRRNEAELVEYPFDGMWSTVCEEEVNSMVIIGHTSVALPKHPSLVINTIQIVLIVIKEEK